MSYLKVGFLVVFPLLSLFLSPNRGSGEAGETGTVPGSATCRGIARPPVDLEMRLLDKVERTSPEEGGDVLVLVRIQTHIDLESAHWSVKLPSGLALRTGSPEWNGSLTAGDEKEIVLELGVVDGKRHELYSRLEANAEPGGRLTRGAGLAIDLGEKDGSEFAKSYRRVDSRGNVVISYRGRQVMEGGE